MAYDYAISSEWLTTTGRPYRGRCRVNVYPIVETKQARYSDMDVNGHLNHLALEALHEDARARINQAYVPDTYNPVNRALRLVTTQNVVHFLAELYWPATVEVGIGIGAIGRTSVVVSSGIFQDDSCISVCDMTLVLVGDDGPVAFANDNRDVMRKLLLRCG